MTALLARAARFASAFALATAAGCGRTPLPSAASALLGQPLSLTLPTDAGALATVPVRGARATVVDFFAPTCAPCREKLPALWGKRDELAADGAKLVLVAVLAEEESTEDARRALASWGMPDAPFLVDTGDASKREADVRVLPTTLVVSAAGLLVWRAPERATADDVVAATR